MKFGNGDLGRLFSSFRKVFISTVEIGNAFGIGVASGAIKPNRQMEVMIDFAKEHSKYKQYSDEKWAALESDFAAAVVAWGDFLTSEPNATITPEIAKRMQKHFMKAGGRCMMEFGLMVLAAGADKSA